MPSQEGIRLSQLIRQRAGEFLELCKGLDEDTGSRAPEGRWSPKQILSHLAGPEGIGFIASIQAFLDQDVPRLDIEPENPFFTEGRARMTLTELVGTVEKEYSRIADLVAGLSDEQLARKAHIPLLKETPMGEFPTLAMWVQAIAEYHVVFHIDHMKEILTALGVTTTR